MQLRRNILIGATHGLYVWLVYGIVEFALACGVPLLFQPEVELLAWQLRPIALVFGAYVVLGVVLGGASGAVLAWIGGRREDGSSSRRRQIMAALGLTVAFAVNLLMAKPLRAAEYVAFGFAVILATLFIRALASSASLERVAFLANPVAVSLLLLTTPWVSRVALTYRSTILKAVVSLLLLGVVLSLAALGHRLRSGRVVGLRRPAVVVGTATLLLLSSVVLSRKPSTARANQQTKSAQPDKPNVVLITMDTVRADHLSVYGYERETTPHLRELAREATLYTHAIATADETLTSHASIFTGLYPGWHDAYLAPPEYPTGRPLSPHYITVAEVLSSQGYWTAGVVANYAGLQPSLGLARGFTTYEYAYPARTSSTDELFYLREGARRLLSIAVDTAVFDAATLRAADINRRAITLLNQAKDNRRFFLFLNYMDAHMPYVPSPPFDKRFPGREPHIKPRWEAGMAFEVNKHHHHLNEAERDHFVSQYDGGIACMDSEIGNFLARLRQLGLYENTLIVIVGDHGEAFGEHNLMTHGQGFVYQDQVHVPLLIKYPGQHEARQSDTLVSQVDLMPTILDVAGITAVAGLEGRSLRSPRDGSEVVYAEARAAFSSRSMSVRRAIFASSSKLITSTEGPPELYDLEADPNETRNQYRSADPRAVALADQLAAWAAAAPPQLAQPHKLDKNSVERLKSLGYAQ